MLAAEDIGAGAAILAGDIRGAATQAREAVAQVEAPSPEARAAGANRRRVTES